MATELPAMSAGTYSSQAVSLAGMSNYTDSLNTPRRSLHHLSDVVAEAARRASTTPTPKEFVMATPTTRLVQVFIADTNPNIPLDSRLIYSGKQMLTDLTDQELFYDIDMKALLEKHNELRVKTVDKKVKERTEYLEPARIRDLAMHVVLIAQF